MGQYTKKGLLNGYKKNNTERAAYDYYATPAVEVENILNTLYEYFGYDFTAATLLEPCVGGGHMADGIDKYLSTHNQHPKEKIAEDYIDRGWRGWQWKTRYGEDFLDDNYESCDPDVIIMNPPYSTIEPFLIRALDLNPQYLIVLCRTQVLEGASRWERLTPRLSCCDWPAPFPDSVAMMWCKSSTQCSSTCRQSGCIHSTVICDATTRRCSWELSGWTTTG